MSSLPDLSPSHITAIGELVVVTGHTEMILTDVIGLITGMNLIDALVTVDHLKASSKIDSLKALTDLYSGDGGALQPMLDLFSSIKDVADFRNTIVHAHWHIDDKGVAHTVRFSARGKLVRSKNPITADQIREKAVQGAALLERLERLADRFRETPRPRQLADAKPPPEPEKVPDDQ